MELVKKWSYRIRVGPKSNNWCLCKRKKRVIQILTHRNTHREEGHMTAAVEAGVMRLQAKVCQEPPEVTRIKEVIGVWPCGRFDFRLLASGAVRANFSGRTHSLWYVVMAALGTQHSQESTPTHSNVYEYESPPKVPEPIMSGDGGGEQHCPTPWISLAESAHLPGVL